VWFILSPFSMMLKIHLGFSDDEGFLMDFSGICLEDHRLYEQNQLISQIFLLFIVPKIQIERHKKLHLLHLNINEFQKSKNCSTNPNSKGKKKHLKKTINF
jgi:hypothetical protein